MNTKTQSFLFLALLCGFLSVKAADAPAKTPVIGIISAGAEDSEDEESYIDLSYVELIEAGGAKAIPIPWNLDDDRFDKLLNSVNGLMIINGDASLWVEDDDKRASRKTRKEREPTEYLETLTYVVDFVIEKKSDGVHLPLWAIGQGFLATALAITEDFSIVTSYYNDGLYKNITFTPAAKKSVLFKGFSQSYFEVLENKTALYFEHEYAIGGSAAATLPAWKNDKWIITSYAQDDTEMGFAAAMESQKYPIYMTMFQPDKTLYDANYNARSQLPGGAIGAIKQMSKNFASEAKKNENNFDPDLLNTLSFDNVELTESDIYILNINTFNSTWAPSFGFIKLVVLVVFIVGGYIGYKKYKQHQENKQFVEYQKTHEQNQPNGGTGAYKNVEMY